MVVILNFLYNINFMKDDKQISWNKLGIIINVTIISNKN